MTADVTQPDSSGDAARSVSNPALLDRFAAAFGATAGEPYAGQVWRARWDFVAQLVLVISTDDDSVDATPLSPDIELGDQNTVIVRAEESALGFDAGAWTSLRSRLPVRVLDVQLGVASGEVVARVAAGQGGGAPITSILDERAQIREAIAERMAHLAEATWVPAADDALDLTAVVRARNLTPGALADELGIEPGLIIAILRGDRRPSPDVAEQMADVLGVEASALQQPVDPLLVRALDRPRFRRRLTERGAAEGINDEAAWRYRVATEKLPAAARTTGPADPYRRWLGLIDDYLR